MTKYAARPREFRRPAIHKVGWVEDGGLKEGGAMPLPELVEIVREPGGDDWMFYRYDRAGHLLSDTWHESLEAAFEQAEYEYGLRPDDFLVVHISESGETG